MAASVTFLDARVGYRSWETMDRWAKARLAKAKSKELELVRIPIHKHGVGWGCTCPDHYIGSMEVAGTSTIWLEPTFEPTAVPVPATETRIAEGYFTGNTSPFRGDEATVYTLLGFRVLRTRIATPSELDMDGEHARVIASGAEAGLEQPPPSDGRAILLLESSFPLGPGAAAAASKRADSLRAKYPNVSVIDSRTAPGLFCCNDVVVLDRFATEREASAEAKRAKSLGIAATVRRGW